MMKTITIGKFINESFVYVLFNYNYKKCRVINAKDKIIQSPDGKIWGIINDYVILIA